MLIGVLNLLYIVSTHRLRSPRRIFPGQFPFSMQHRASALLLSPCPDHASMLMYRISCRNIVPTFAPQVLHLVRQTGSFEEPVSKQWAIPISSPYSPNSAFSLAHHFISFVMGRITHGYADALVDGGFLQRVDADAFMDELDERAGICRVYQTVCVRKRSIF